MHPVLSPQSLIQASGRYEALKVARTVSEASSVTWHDPVPPQAPLHPTNVEFALVSAVSVTTVLAANDAWHVPPQVIPAGLLATDPPPVPRLTTFRTGSVPACAGPGDAIEETSRQRSSIGARRLDMPRVSSIGRRRVNPPPTNPT